MMAGRGEGAAGGPARHIPVMLAEVVETLDPQNGDTIIDGTFGAGGYTRAILEAADCKVIAIDRDPRAIAGGEDLASAYPDRLKLVLGRFAEMQQIAEALETTRISGIVLDLGSRRALGRLQSLFIQMQQLLHFGCLILAVQLKNLVVPVSLTLSWIFVLY